MSHTPAPETQVNTHTTGEQSTQQITALADGGWVVTWTSNGQDADAGGVFQQVYNADGTVRGGESQVNFHTASDQSSPRITALYGGGWVVTWQSYLQDGDSWGIYQHAYNADGSTLSAETQVNTYTAGEQSIQQITALADGGWVVTWQSYGQDGDAWGIYQQAYDADGDARGGETPVNTYTAAYQMSPAITALADGGWVVTWQSDEQDGSEAGIYQQPYDADGTARGGETRVNTETDGDQTSPRITALADGGWVVTWQSDGQDGWGDIHQQAFDADGNRLGGEAQVNAYTIGDQGSFQITALADGGWVVSWQSMGQDGSGYGVYQQAYDADGIALGDETQVNTYTTDDQKSPQTTALADGGWVVTWESYGQDGSSYGVYQQAYNADGSARGGETQVNTYTSDWQRSPVISALADGGWVVTWTSSGQDGDATGIHQQRYDALGQIYGTNHAPTASDATLAAREDTAYTLSVSDFGFSDGSDGDSLSAVIIATVPLLGTLTLDGVAVHAGDSIDAVDIAAGKLVYTPSIDATGDDFSSLTFRVVDDGGTASGGFDTSSTHALAFDVASVNDAPTAADNSLSLYEDVAYTFAPSTFGFSDNEAEDGSLSAVIITTLPSAGTLTLDGVAVQAGDAIDASDIAAGKLVYVPPADAYGDDLASLIFQVVDDGGTDNGGVDTSGTYTITFDVVPVPAVETQVNTYTSGDQFDPHITALTGGGWVVTWTSSGQDGNDDGVYQQAYNADGTERGSETRVNTYTDNAQNMPETAALADGGWVVTWTSDGQDGSVSGVYQQAFNADGSAQGGETQVNTFIPFWQSSQQVTALADGGWVVTWQCALQDNGYGVYQQVYDADGSALGGETRVNTETAGDQGEPTITSLADGGWVVTWLSFFQDGSYFGIYQQAYNADGSRLGGEIQVNTYTDDFQWQTQVAALADGGWVVTWMSSFQDGSGDGIYQQAYNADGTERGDETRVNTTTFGQQMEQQIAALADGGWVVTWTSEYLDGSGFGVFQQVYKADGTTLGEETQVNTYTPDNQGSPQITALADGGWVVAWFSDYQDDDDRGVYQQAYNADGTRLGGETLVNTYTPSAQWSQQIAALPDGGWVVTWNSYGQDGDRGGIYQQRFDAEGQVYGTNHAPTASDATLTAIANTAYTFSTAVFGFADAIDGDGLSAVIITTLPASGTLKLNGVAVTAGASIDASDIAAGRLIYMPATGVSGTGLASLTFRVVDDGGTEGGGFDTSASRTITFNVSAVVPPANVAPTASDATLTTREDTAYAFSAADFGFSDSDGDSLDHVTIKALPGSGTLTLNGVAVAANQQIAATALSRLVWTPAADAHGTGLASLRFTVTDDGGTAHGGRDTSTAHTLTFNVTPLNDAPVLGFDTASTAENRVLTMDVLADAVDVDGDTLTITGATVTSGFGSVKTAGGKLVYDPTAAPDQNIDKGESREVMVSYTVSDGHGESVTQTITITVDGVSSDVIRGTNGADTLTGSDGGNTLSGRGGKDVLEGGLGADRLSGGKGADTFLFRDIDDSTPNPGGRDLILDFSQREHDRIDLHLIDANETRSGNQAFRFIGSDDFHGRAGELRFEARSGHTLIQADTDGDGKADFAILLDDATNLRQSDFLL
jgi:hypothetical protein